MRKNHIKLIFLVSLLLIFSVTTTCFVYAQEQSVAGQSEGSSNTKALTIQGPLKDVTIGDLVYSIIDIFTYLVILLAVVAIIWVGLKYVMARGNTEKMKEASKWLTSIVIGVAVVIGARVIIQIVIDTLRATNVVSEKVLNSADSALKGQVKK